jgi:EAL domain-containing protein (putative c-di-GMP-specific phosphodiesterase class I)
MPLSTIIEAAIPIERDERILRARRTAAKARIAMGLIGVGLIVKQPQLLPYPWLGLAGFGVIELTAIMQLAAMRPAWLKFEESTAGAAAVLIIGMGGQNVTALSILWLAAIASGVMARGGRVHWFGSLIVFVALALPVVREQHFSGQYAAVCAAALGLLLTCGRLTRELNQMLRDARRQAESAETLLLAGDIAARMTDRNERAAGTLPAAPLQPNEMLSAQEISSAREALEHLIAGEGLSMVVQPIFDVRNESPVPHAYEALARFGEPRLAGSPLHWFSLAQELGERPALERACLRGALELLAQRPFGTSLSVNLSAPVLLDSETIAMLEAVGDAGVDDLAGLIVEITEETLVGGDIQLGSAIELLRARGARLAVDDMGAGYSGLRQITAVHPTYLKLDRSLVSGIDEDDERAALVGALAGYSKQVGSMLVAEGVETQAELQAIRRLGVPLVQGFYLGRPGAPWPQLSIESRGDTPAPVDAPAPVVLARAGGARRDAASPAVTTQRTAPEDAQRTVPGVLEPVA